MKKISKKCIGVLWGTLIVVFLCSCGRETVHYVEEEENIIHESELKEPDEEKNTEQEKKNICIYVCGQVVTPGVYTLVEGSRVCDAFEMAGGFTENAAIDYWNQARVLVDGEMIYVPTAEEAKERQPDGGISNQTDTEDQGKVNINTASKEELMTLPGIGEAKALAILSYRQDNGAFNSIEELKEIEGIKDGVFSKIKDFIEI